MKLVKLGPLLLLINVLHIAISQPRNLTRKESPGLLCRSPLIYRLTNLLKNAPNEVQPEEDSLVSDPTTDICWEHITIYITDKNDNILSKKSAYLVTLEDHNYAPDYVSNINEDGILKRVYAVPSNIKKVKDKYQKTTSYKICHTKIDDDKYSDKINSDEIYGPGNDYKIENENEILCDNVTNETINDDVNKPSSTKFTEKCYHSHEENLEEEHTPIKHKHRDKQFKKPKKRKTNRPSKKPRQYEELVTTTDVTNLEYFDDEDLTKDQTTFEKISQNEEKENEAKKPILIVDSNSENDENSVPKNAPDRHENIKPNAPLKKLLSLMKKPVKKNMLAPLKKILSLLTKPASNPKRTNKKYNEDDENDDKKWNEGNEYDPEEINAVSASDSISKNDPRDEEITNQYKPKDYEYTDEKNNLNNSENNSPNTPIENTIDDSEENIIDELNPIKSDLSANFKKDNIPISKNHANTENKSPNSNEEDTEEITKNKPETYINGVPTKNNKENYIPHQETTTNNLVVTLKKETDKYYDITTEYNKEDILIDKTVPIIIDSTEHENIDKPLLGVDNKNSPAKSVAQSTEIIETSSIASKIPNESSEIEYKTGDVERPDKKYEIIPKDVNETTSSSEKNNYRAIVETTDIPEIKNIAENTERTGKETTVKYNEIHPEEVTIKTFVERNKYSFSVLEEDREDNISEDKRHHSMPDSDENLDEFYPQIHKTIQPTTFNIPKSYEENEENEPSAKSSGEDFEKETNNNNKPNTDENYDDTRENIMTYIPESGIAPMNLPRDFTIDKLLYDQNHLVDTKPSTDKTANTSTTNSKETPEIENVKPVDILNKISPSFEDKTKRPILSVDSNSENEENLVPKDDKILNKLLSNKNNKNKLNENTLAHLKKILALLNNKNPKQKNKKSKQKQTNEDDDNVDKKWNEENLYDPEKIHEVGANKIEPRDEEITNKYIPKDYEYNVEKSDLNNSEKESPNTATEDTIHDSEENIIDEPNPIESDPSSEEFNEDNIPKSKEHTNTQNKSPYSSEEIFDKITKNKPETYVGAPIIKSEEYYIPFQETTTKKPKNKQFNILPTILEPKFNTISKNPYFKNVFSCVRRYPIVKNIKSTRKALGFASTFFNLFEDKNSSNELEIFDPNNSIDQLIKNNISLNTDDTQTSNSAINYIVAQIIKDSLYDVVKDSKGKKPGKVENFESCLSAVKKDMDKDKNKDNVIIAMIIKHILKPFKSAASSESPIFDKSDTLPPTESTNQATTTKYAKSTIDFETETQKTDRTTEMPKYLTKKFKEHEITTEANYVTTNHPVENSEKTSEEKSFKDIMSEDYYTKTDQTTENPKKLTNKFKEHEITTEVNYVPTKHPVENNEVDSTKIEQTSQNQIYLTNKFKEHEITTEVNNFSIIYPVENSDERSEGKLFEDLTSEKDSSETTKKFETLTEGPTYGILKVETENSSEEPTGLDSFTEQPNVMSVETTDEPEIHGSVIEIPKTELIDNGEDRTKFTTETYVTNSMTYSETNKYYDGTTENIFTDDSDIRKTQKSSDSSKEFLSTYANTMLSTEKNFLTTTDNVTEHYTEAVQTDTEVNEILATPKEETTENIDFNVDQLLEYMDDLNKNTKTPTEFNKKSSKKFNKPMSNQGKNAEIKNLIDIAQKLLNNKKYKKRRTELRIVLAVLQSLLPVDENHKHKTQKKITRPKIRKQINSIESTSTVTTLNTIDYIFKDIENTSGDPTGLYFVTDEPKEIITVDNAEDTPEIQDFTENYLEEPTNEVVTEKTVTLPDFPNEEDYQNADLKATEGTSIYNIPEFTAVPTELFSEETTEISKAESKNDRKNSIVTTEPSILRTVIGSKRPEEVKKPKSRVIVTLYPSHPKEKINATNFKAKITHTVGNSTTKECYHLSLAFRKVVCSLKQDVSVYKVDGKVTALQIKQASLPKNLRNFFPVNKKDNRHCFMFRTIKPITCPKKQHHFQSIIRKVLSTIDNKNPDDKIDNEEVELKKTNHRLNIFPVRIINISQSGYYSVQCKNVINLVTKFTFGDINTDYYFNETTLTEEAVVEETKTLPEINDRNLIVEGENAIYIFNPIADTNCPRNTYGLTNIVFVHNNTLNKPNLTHDKETPMFLNNEGIMTKQLLPERHFRCFTIDDKFQKLISICPNNVDDLPILQHPELLEILCPDRMKSKIQFENLYKFLITLGIIRRDESNETNGESLLMRKLRKLTSKHKEKK